MTGGTSVRGNGNTGRRITNRNIQRTELRQNVCRLEDKTRDFRMHIDSQKAQLTTAKKQRNAHEIALDQRKKDYQELGAKLNVLTRVKEQNKKNGGWHGQFV